VAQHEEEKGKGGELMERGRRMKGRGRGNGGGEREG